jgi:hypothetical protein
MDFQTELERLRALNWYHWLGHICGVVTTVLTAFYYQRRRQILKGAMTPEVLQAVERLEPNIMSDFSRFLHALGDAFSKAQAAAPPAQQATLSQAGTQVQAAGSAIVGAIPALAVGAANVAMDLFPVTKGFEPVADMFIEALIAELESRKSTAAVPATTLPAAPAAAPAALFSSPTAGG